MPILPREVDIFPPDLLDRPSAVELGCHWWALYTLSRREKELMRRLRAAEIPFYAPLVKQRSRSPAGRLRTAYVPLFPGYVFVCGDDEQRRRALATNCVSRSLPVANARQLEHDLRQVRQLIDSDAPLTPEARLEPGMRVRVRIGPLAGLEGMVVRRHGQQRLLIAVEFLQQGASVQLEDIAVERID
jgi:transcription antitermination factor NusG